MKIQKLLIVIMLLFLISCTIEEDDREKNFIICNTYGNIFVELNPTIQLPRNEIECMNYLGEDSLDLNYDGKYDIKFYNHNLAPDLVGNCFHNGDFFPNGYLDQKINIINDNIQIAMRNGFVVKFSCNDTISKHKNWSTTKELTMLHYAYFPPDNSSHQGEWKFTDGYVGFKLLIDPNKFIYGWVHLLTLNYNIEIKDFCISKE